MVARSHKWAGFSFGTLKERPAASIFSAMNGSVRSSNDRRPRVWVYMVHKAGNAPAEYQ